MRRVVIATVAVLAAVAAGVLAWEFVPLSVMAHDGGFDLTVRIESQAGQLKLVGCEILGTREDADETVAFALLPSPESRSWSTVCEPFDGRPFTVGVAVSWQESPFGRVFKRSQMRFLAVIAVLADDHLVGKVVEIPDGRVSREVTVELP